MQLTEYSVQKYIPLIPIRSLKNYLIKTLCDLYGNFAIKCDLLGISFEYVAGTYMYVGIHYGRNLIVT